MRYFTAFLILACWSALHSLTIIDDGREISISLEELRELEQIEIITEREDERGVRIENWQGVLLSEIFTHYGIDNQAPLKFNSYDGYQVRIKVEEYQEYPILIALQRDGKNYEEDDLRLVIPGMRDMFWMQAVKIIRTENYRESTPPYYILFAEDLLSGMEVAFEPEPFRNVQGYYLAEMLSLVYPFQQDEYFLIGRDGVSHQLEFQMYLKNAVLVAADDGGYTLQGGDIPYGMWIKDIAYIQCYDRAIIFREQFRDLDEVGQLLEWENLPEHLHTEDGSRIGIDIEFSEPVWKDSGIFRWVR
jgi:hypothetical protein